MKIHIKGYYGFENLGDDYILYSLIKLIEKHRGCYQITVISKGDKMGNVFNMFPKMQLNNILLGTQEWASEKVHTKESRCKNVDLFIIGGGGLFPQDNFKVYAFNLIQILEYKFFGKSRVIIYGVDVCEIKGMVSKLVWKLIGIMVDGIVLRNGYSYHLLEKIVNKNKLLESSDVTFSLTTPFEKNISLLLDIKKELGIIDKKYIIWALAMPWSEEELHEEKYKRRYEHLVNVIASECKRCVEKGFINLFMPFFKGNDRHLIGDVTKKVGIESVVCEEDKIPFEAKRALFKDAYACVSMRFHGIAFSLYNATPVIAIAYAQKSVAIMEENGLEEYCIPFGVRTTTGFKKEFDIDENKLSLLIDKIIYSNILPEFSKARDNLTYLAGCGEQFLEKMLDAY